MKRVAKVVGWMVLGQAFLLLFLYLNLALWLGEYVDSVCTEGRLSADQASLINGREWDKCPKYRQRQNGLGPLDSCSAESRDRVVAHECSDFLRHVAGRDNKRLTEFRNEWQTRILGRRI